MLQTALHRFHVHTFLISQKVKCFFSALNSDYTFSDDRYEHARYFMDNSDTTVTGVLKSQPMQFKTFADTIWTRLGVM